MPLFTRVLGVGAARPPSSEPGPTTPPASPDGVTRYLIDTVDGGHFDLTDWGAGFRVMPGTRGYDAPPKDITVEELPQGVGARFRTRTVKVRELGIPIIIRASTRAEFVARKRTFLEHIYDGTFVHTVVEPDGTRRQITAMYAGGLEGSEGVDQAFRTWQKYVLVLWALDPYWSAATPIVQRFRVEQGATWYPIYPLRVGSSQVLGDTTLSNPGSVPAWPVIVIGGPGQFTATNHRTGQTIMLGRVLTGAEVATIDTRPPSQAPDTYWTATLADGTNIWAELDDSSAVASWSLERGDNKVTLELAGAQTGSLVTVSLVPQFLTA